MKLKNFKMLSLIIAAFALFAFSGCDGTTGISSDSGIGTEITTSVPDAGTSTVTANLGSVLADGTSTSTVTVTVKDAASNPITDAAVSLAQTGSSTIGAVTNNGDGTYMFDVTSTTVETVTYTATADTVAITQTVNVDFTAVPPPVPDAATSTVTANPASVLADGTTTSTVTVTVKDELSNPIINAAVSLAQTGSSTIGAVTNNGDGTYMFDVTSTTVETVTYTATADTVVITQTADVNFTETEAQCLLAAGYGTIDINSRTWLDKNLGAINPATGPTDTDAYGDYYQWGRSADGHQVSTSDVNDTLAANLNSSNTNTDWYGKFIESPSAPYDWTTVDSSGNTRSTSWSTPYDANQVCPCGYVVPTVQDFEDLNMTSEPANATKFNSANAGWRQYQDGVLAGTTAVYWTSDQEPGGSRSISYYFNNDTTILVGRATGLPIRCIKP